MTHKTSGWAIASLIFGILFFIPFTPLLAIVFGAIALHKISKNPELKGKGLAIAGILLGVFVGLFLTILLIPFIFMAGMFNPSYMIPDRCSFDQGFLCDDFLVTDTHVTIALSNDLGKDIVVTQLTVLEDGEVNCVRQLEVPLPTNERITLDVEDCDFDSKNVQVDLELLWHPQDANQEFIGSSHGELRATISE